VEGRVEDGDVRDVRQELTGALERGERGRVVQRSEGRQLSDRRDDLVVHDDVLAEAPATVHDAVPDRADTRPGRLLQALERPRLVAVDEVELEARRARVDREDGRA